MHVSVYSLKKTLFEGEAVSLTCNTSLGQLTVLPHHQPLISDIREGVMKIVDATQQEHFLNLTAGFLEMKPENAATCIVEEES